VSIPLKGSACGSTTAGTTAVSKHYYTRISRKRGREEERKRGREEERKRGKLNRRVE
jgi:hypothetical protein